MANDAAALLDSLDIESAHVLGVSMGAMIAQELVIEHPSKVRSLCSIMSNTGDGRAGGIAPSMIAKLALLGEPSHESAVEHTMKVSKLITGPGFDHAVFHAAVVAAVERCYTPAGVARQTAAMAGSRDRTELLAGIRAPTLVIHGLADQLVQPSGGVATASAIPDSRLLAFGDMGHDLPASRWQEMTDAILLNSRRQVQVRS